jgi:DNA-binding NarL/FixJ family response regulator
METFMDLISVLLVDDNPTFLRILRDFLSEEEDILVVGTARSGEEALVKAKELRPQVILLDLAMPGLNGFNTAPRLRSMMPDVGIIALTVLDANGYREAAVTAGADDYVAKASLNADLLPAIRRVTQERRSIGEAAPAPA